MGQTRGDNIVALEDTTFKAVFAMLCVTLLECVALMNGVNGNFFGVAIFAIGTFAGFALKDDIIALKKRCFK